MDVFPPELFIFAFVAFLAGLLVMWLLNYASSGEKKQRQAPTSVEAQGSVDEEASLCVRRARGGRLSVFVRGRRYRSLKEITDAEVGRETIEAIGTVMEFAGEWLPALRQQAASVAPTEPDSGADQHTFLQQLRQTPKPPSGGSLAPPARPAVREPGSMLDPLNFVEDIDDKVQQKLKARPALADRFVRLTTGIGGGLRIYVDKQVFSEVSEVPDPEIRTIIQDAIREWESE